MPSNLVSTLAATITVVDNTLSPAPQIITRSLNNPAFSGTTVFYDPFLQVGTGATVLSLPGALIVIVYVKNLSGAANVLVTWTPNGGASVSAGVIAPGGVLSYFQPTNSAGTAISGVSNGITAISLTASAASTSCEVMLGA